jgi:hypothetical protein
MRVVFLSELNSISVRLFFLFQKKEPADNDGVYQQLTLDKQFLKEIKEP